MNDVHTPAVRSKNMRAIRSKNTKPELLVRKALHAAGFRFRLHAAKLPGKPDLVMPRYQSVVFVHGCFWHGHDCKYFTVPKSRPEFWLAKIGANRARDIRDCEELNRRGWNVIVIWECATRASGPGLPEVVRRVTRCLSPQGTAPAVSVSSIAA